jgi:uncharacterized protein (TIGR03435 family)
MLQALLADRFELRIHRETKDLPVYALAIARGGLKVKPLADDAAPASAADPVNIAAIGGAGGVGVDLGGGASFQLGNDKLDIHEVTFMAMADMLTRFVDRPVVDTTNTPGRFNLTLELTPEDYRAMLVRSAINAGVVLPPQALRALDNASGNPVAAPLQPFGLTLDATRTSLEVIVVDSALRSPTAN